MSRQSLAALKQANAVRIAQAEFIRDIRSLARIEGRWVLADALENQTTPPPVGALRLDRFIQSAERTGVSAMESIYAQADMQRRDVRIRDLTASERSRLANALRIEKLPRATDDLGRRR